MRSLFLLLVAALGAIATLAWVRVGQDRYASLEQQGAALASVVRGATLEATVRLESAERNLARRLTAVARCADGDIAGTRQPAAEVLQRIAAEGRVGRIFLWDAAGHPVVRVQHPMPIAADRPGLLSGDRKRKLQWAAAQRSLAAATPGPNEARIEGLRLNAFGTRERFGVLYGRKNGGTLLLLADGDELANLRQRFGLDPMLRRVLEVPSVVAVQLLAADGTPRVAVGEAPEPEVAATTPLRSALVGDSFRSVLPVETLTETLHAVVWLERAAADRVVAAARRSILIGALLALVVALGAGVLLTRRERIHRAQQREAATRLEEERRLAEMGALAGLVTHEVNNPLNSIRLALGVLEGTEAGRTSAGVIDTMKAEVARMEQTLGGYMALAGGELRARRPISADLLKLVARRVKSEVERRGLRLRIAVAPDAPTAAGDPVVLEQALTSLVRNALQASPAGGCVHLRWSHAEGGGVELAVVDEGQGFPQDRAALLRLGGSRREAGHGLGLPLAKRFIESSGGRLTLENAPAGGARVVVHLPAWQEDRAPHG